ncbi:GNAT family N-acetyltransferase [Anaerosporobacter sp.]|uniref:GNAT family N-acetyltransferase n=1 Tax=Anaerosporobacter sp. TaxID=1872529 RepID=UPI00286F9F6B|nr:GNAT family N-acetyltransferase [Anaerosporobacter sp.]
MKIQQIETQRLYIRGFTKDDARFAISIWNDPEMGEYLPDPTLEDIDEAYLKQIEELGEHNTCFYLISELRESHERIGTCSFIPSKDGTVYDIAYCVHRMYWNNGYATEMVNGMIEYAKQHGAKKITVNVNKDNVASNTIVKKFGFEVVGEHTYKKSGTDLEFTDYKYELSV